MDRDIEKEIAEAEAELSMLPTWNIVSKNVNGKTYYYRRYRSDGKYRDTYLDFDLVDGERAQIAKRKELEKKLKELKLRAMNGGKNTSAAAKVFSTKVRTGDELLDFVKETAKPGKRECYGSLRNFVHGTGRGKVFILYGLRRTGKSTLMCQVIADMEKDDFRKTAYIQITPRNTITEVDRDLSSLKSMGYRYVFIDEVTFLDDFIECAEMFSDFYAACGMRIVLSGTDSLGFRIASEEKLFDRCFLCHTTFIPYREFENVLGICGIDEYISRGGTMSVSGENYNWGQGEGEKGSVSAYVNTSIAKNIQNSLKNYDGGGHFRNLYDLYRCDELTSAINGVVENINHEFAVEVLTSDFDSRDLTRLAQNMRVSPVYRTEAVASVDRDAFNDRLRAKLDILNSGERKVRITEAHVREIREYLVLLNLIYEIEEVFYDDDGPASNRTLTVLSQPGLRYAQAEAFVESLSSDEVIGKIPDNLKNVIFNEAKNTIRGGIMEEIVQLETKFARTDKRVFKLKFSVGEIDMVVQDRKAFTCELYEIKHASTINPVQRKNLKSKDKCSKIEYSFGRITGKYVIYRGEDTTEGGVRFLNVEKYLKSLGVKPV
ncbi:MAG: AAA family ATPase [Clostridia bacterium]|nr:AAA family ATPase [Clostridia bacterium]